MLCALLSGRPRRPGAAAGRGAGNVAPSSLTFPRGLARTFAARTRGAGLLRPDGHAPERGRLRRRRPGDHRRAARRRRHYGDRGGAGARRRRRVRNVDPGEPWPRHTRPDHRPHRHHQRHGRRRPAGGRGPVRLPRLGPPGRGVHRARGPQRALRRRPPARRRAGARAGLERADGPRHAGPGAAGLEPRGRARPQAGDARRPRGLAHPPRPPGPGRRPRHRRRPARGPGGPGAAGGHAPGGPGHRRRPRPRAAPGQEPPGRRSALLPGRLPVPLRRRPGPLRRQRRRPAQAGPLLLHGRGEAFTNSEHA